MSAVETPYYPPTPASARTVSGGTASGATVTATTTTVTVTRTLTPLFVRGSAGILTWAVTVDANVAITSVTFRLLSGQDRKQVVRPGRPASAVLSAAAGDSPVTVQIVVACPVGAVLTLSEKWEQQPSGPPRLVLAEPGFGDASPNGAPPPPASMALPASEADSPARRSPQVRAAQLQGSTRPDLLPRCSSLL